MSQPADAPVLTRSDIERAADLIGGWVRRTPVIEYAVPGPGGRDLVVHLKLECFQHAGSFKPRGAFTSVLSAAEPPTRLVAASGGNHGLAVAHVGAALEIETDVFVPTLASRVKVEAIEARGARVHVGGDNYAAALSLSLELAQLPGTLALHAYDTVPTVTGQGTLASELQAQVPDLDVVVVAVGGGGLVGGLASWYADPTTIATAGTVGVVAVEPVGCPALHEALLVGEPVTTSVAGVAADALGASQIGSLGLAAMQRASGKSTLVTDDQIMSARQLLWRDLRLVVEPAGATALAGVLSGAVWDAVGWSPELNRVGPRVGVIVCGANTDPSDLVTG